MRSAPKRGERSRISVAQEGSPALPLEHWLNQSPDPLERLCGNACDLVRSMWLLTVAACNPGAGRPSEHELLVFTARLRLVMEHAGPEWPVLRQANPYPVEAGGADSHVELASHLAARSYIALLRAWDPIVAANWGVVGKPTVLEIPPADLLKNWEAAAAEILALPRFDHNQLEGQIRKEMQRAIEQRKRAANDDLLNGKQAIPRHGEPVVVNDPAANPGGDTKLDMRPGEEFEHGMALAIAGAKAMQAGLPTVAEGLFQQIDSDSRLSTNTVIKTMRVAGAVVPLGSVQVLDAATHVGATGDAVHSPDFRSVHWYGTNYTFTANQAAVVKELWQAWLSGAPDVGGQTLLEAADVSHQRVDVVFRDSAAWKNMIRPGTRKGTYRLVPPQQNPTLRKIARVAHV